MMKSIGALTSFPLLVALVLLPGSAQAQRMGGSMMDGMMWLMVVFWLLIAAVLVLTIAALVKYLIRK
ncbi:putative protein OS=Castellaniella defragrans OX=75697 GN=HNR28_003548 PE=4 SV=1 [Castellaniella defragrans]